MTDLADADASRDAVVGPSEVDDSASTDSGSAEPPAYAEQVTPGSLAGLLDDDSDDFVADDPFLTHDGIRVATVVVGHDGSRWLPVTLAALRAQDRPSEVIVGVDTGSVDDTAQLLEQALGADAVVAMPRETGFGAAVAQGVEAAGDCDWIWVLHDDCAPRADALRRLLDVAVSRTGAAIVGPKVLGWADRTHLLEVGLTTARGGRRETGLERMERDQGQHDQERDVLAVGSAGMLVRRDVWDALGGFDPDLPLFRDDIDLGWRAQRAGHRVLVAPRAVVHHAEASTRHRRAADAVQLMPERADRAHAMAVVLANSATWTIPILVVRLLLGSLARIVGFLIGKDAAAARDEAGALVDVFAHPGRLRAARRRRAGGRTVPDREVGKLLAPPGAQVRHALEAVAGALTTTASDGDDLPRSGLEAGPGDDDFEDLQAQGPSFLSRLLRRPGALGALALAAVTLIAVRSLIGSGRLLGGALLPAPDGIGQWWDSFLAAWHPVSVGSPEAAPPTLAMLSALGVPTLGQAPAVVDAVVLLAVPLAFVSAYVSLRGVTRSLTLRLWAAASYALLPAVTGAIAAGRIGTLVAAILLPPLARAFAHLVGLGEAPPGRRAAWGTALLLAVVGAFVPLVWVAAVLLAVVAAFTIDTDRTSRWYLAIAVTAPLVLWLPWSLRLFTDPSLLFLEAGATPPDIADPALPSWWLLGLDPGGPGTGTWWVGLGVLAAALAALLRPARRDAVRIAWLIAIGAFALALLVSRLTVTPPGSIPVAAWPGTATLIAGLALLVAAVVGNESSGRRLAATGFSWRQVVAAAVTALAVLTPLTWALSWMERGAEGPISRTDPQLLPAFVAAQSTTPARPRTLVLRPDPERVTYALLRDTGPTLGDAEVAPDSATLVGLDEVVADLASGRGGVEAARLANYAVGFVQVEAPVAPEFADRLDAVPGLSRIGAPDGGALWRVQPLAARARLIPDRGPAVVLPAGEVTAGGPVPADWPGGRLVLADPADSGWRATLNGRELAPLVVDDWSQGWELPEGAEGELAIGYNVGLRAVWWWVAGVALVVVLVLALPYRRRDDGDGEDA